MMADFSSLWGGSGFGGPFSQLTGNSFANPAALPSAPPVGPGPGNMAAWWGGRGVGGPGAALTGDTFTHPGQGSDLWSRLMNSVGDLGQFKMPGTTIGAPAGSNQAPPQPPQLLPQYQMQAPRGIAALQQAPFVAPGGGNLMAQYAALQQLMRGA